MSELTVPRAGTAAAPTAADIRPMPVAAAGVAQLGQRIGELGLRVETDRLNRQMARAQVDLENDLGNLALETQQIGDPDAADAHWADGSKSLRDTYLNGTDQYGRPRIDRKNAERFGLAFDSVANRHALQLGERGMVLRQSQRLANLYDYETVGQTVAAGSDPDRRADVYASFDQMVDESVAAGDMTPEEAAKRKHGFRIGVESSDALTLIDEDPEGLLDAAASGEFPSVAPDTVAGWRARAHGAIEARTRAEKTAAERARTERLQKGKAELQDLKNVLSVGRAGQNEALIDDPELAAEYPYLVAELKGMRHLRDRGFYAGEMSRPKLEAELARLTAKKTNSGAEADEIAAIKAQIAADDTGFQNDPMAYARKKRLPEVRVTELPNPETASPSDYAAALRSAQADAEELQKNGHVEDVPLPVTKAELADLKIATGPKADPERRTELSRAIGSDFADKPEVLSKLGLDPVFVHVAGLQASGGAPPQLARDILRGQSEIEAGNIIMPTPKDRIDAGFIMLGALFEQVPGGETLKSEIRASTDALYATRKGGVDPASGEIDEDAYRQALHEVMGGTGEYDSYQARGGVQLINDTPTLLPPGVRGTDVTAALKDVGDELEGIAGGFVGGGVQLDRAGRASEARKAGEARLKSASLTGGLPTIGGAPLTGDDLLSSDTFIYAKGGDEYYLAYRSQDGVRFYEDSTKPGEIWSFSLRALTRRTGQ